MKKKKIEKKKEEELSKALKKVEKSIANNRLEEVEDLLENIVSQGKNIILIT